MSDPLFDRFGREFEVGHVLFREAEPGSEMFVVQTGVIRISKRIGDDDKTLALLGPGEFVGEMAILNDKPRTATATVEEGPARCLVLDAQTMEVMVTKNAEIAVRLIKKLSKRLDSADTLIEILMHRDPKARVLMSLVRNAEAFGVPTSEGLLVRTNSSDIAKQVGVDFDVAEQLFVRLRRLRLIELADENKTLVSDLRRLEEFIEFLDAPSQATPSQTT